MAMLSAAAAMTAICSSDNSDKAVAALNVGGDTPVFLIVYIHRYIRFKKVDKRNLNRESYIGMHTVNYT